MDERGQHERTARASWLSALVLMAPLSVFAELLIRKTHHRPLAAVTFACVAVLAWVLAELLSRRVLDSRISPGRTRARWIVIWCGAVGGAVILLRAFT